MNQDVLYQAIRTEIEKDIRPVRPLRAPWQRAFLVGAVCLVLAMLIPILTGIRTDYPILGAWLVWSLTLFQLAASYGLAAGTLRLVIPGRLPAVILLICLIGLGLLVQVASSALIFMHSPSYPPPGKELQLWIACLLITATLGIAPAATGFLLGLRGLAFRARLFGSLCGLGAGFGAEAVWRLHCPISDPLHIGIGHDGAILALGLLGIVAGAFWERRTLSSGRAPGDLS